MGEAICKGCRLPWTPPAYLKPEEWYKCPTCAERDLRGLIIKFFERRQHQIEGRTINPKPSENA